MTSNLDRPDADALFTRIQQMFQNTMLGGATVVPESNEWYAISLNYAMMEEFYAISEQAWKERDPRQACLENLVLMAARDGVYPRAAVPAQGYLKLTGTAAAALPAPLDFTVDGTQYVTATDTLQPTALDDTGNAVIRVRAVTPGSAGNITATTGTLDTAVANVNAAVEVCGGSFCAGADAEDGEVFRQRYLRRLQYQPRATVEWIKEKLLEWPCATRAVLREGSCCGCGCEEQAIQLGSTATGCEDCGCVECGGKMNFYVLFDDSFDNGIAPETTLREIEDWMFGTPQGYGLGQVEMGVCGKIVPVTAVQVDVFVDIVDCPTSADLANVQTVVEEFFKTVEPSKAVSSNSLSSALTRLLGDTDIDVRIELVNAADGYGASYGPSDADSKVYVSGCSLEPDCDYTLTLNEVTITRTNNASAGCP